MKQQINGNNPIRVLHMAPIRMGGITELVLTLSEKIDFEKVQFRVAKVLTCEAVKKTKLLKFELQIGDEKRTIVSGIQKYYKPEELIGKKLVVCTNLKPRKICGIESQGMIISAWDDKDNLSVLTLEKDIIEGAEIG